ncbi:MAG: hypothetical protein HND27_02190 [Bacteroidetes bacterium]|nr:hypothetical protein [Flavobacteriales bacterium]NOG94568.1 hypothetical protein [Bacteroidota bacterium]GIK69137.1 MAG: hypothetical protein BroJett020_04320 [Bacteroidota bacterium]CAG0950430.1 hypothetical protein FLAV_00166 [Flavobacteriales bacterium]
MRVNGHLFVGKNAYISDTTFSNVLKANRITPNADDSLLYFGDSSLVVNTVSHLIYPEADFDIPNPIIKGTGIGSPNITPKGDYSVAVGHRIKIDIVAKNSLAIGTGVLPNGPYLQQYIPNTIMMGTNSNLPTLFISPAGGPNTIGKVGIGTLSPAGTLHVANGNAIFEEKVGIGSSNPAYKLEVCGTIKAKEVIIETGPWCDFKLKPEYIRMTWQEKLSYIKSFGHLPEIDPGSEIENNGLKTTKNLRGMIWNIEDNTMDIISLQQENAEKNKKIDMLQQEIEDLKKAIILLKKK